MSEEAPIERRKSTLLEERVSAMESDIRALSHNFESFSADIKAAIGRMQDHRRTSWPALASWAGVILMIVTMAGSGYVRDQARIEKALIKLTDSHIEHMSEDGHRAMMQRVSSVEEELKDIRGEIKDLDAILQREMRLLDDAVVEKIEAMDAKLQQEMRRLDLEAMKGGEYDD